MRMRKRIIGVVTVALLVASTAVAATPQPTPERDHSVVVQADFIGPPIPFPYEGSPGGVTYMVSPEGETTILWADSEDGLDEGETALWYGDQVDEDAARQYLEEAGVLVPEVPEIPPAEDPTVMAWVLCTLWAWDPVLNPGWMEAEASHFCSGNWIAHKVRGKLQRKWGWFWRTEDTQTTLWEFDDNTIWATTVRTCGSNDETDWRSKATGWVRYDGGSSTRNHTSDRVDDVECRP